HFVAAFERAEQQGPCAGDAGTVESRADSFVVVGILIVGSPPSTTSTTSTTFPGLCGNGIVDAGEECDGQSFCTPGCTFAPSVCCILPPGAPAPCIGLAPTRFNYMGCYFEGGLAQSGTCGLDGMCQDQAIGPISICCQFGDGCETDTAASVGDLASILFNCEG